MKRFEGGPGAGTALDVVLVLLSSRRRDRRLAG
jgi:hypothetical protein